MRDLGFHGGEIETRAQPEAEAIIALRILQMKGFEVHADEARLFGRHGDVGAAAFDFDRRCVDPRNVDNKFYRVGVVLAIVGGLAEVID